MGKEFNVIVQDLLGEAENKFSYVTATLFSNRGIAIELDKNDENLSSIRSNLGLVLSIFNGEYFEEFATDLLDIDHLVRFFQEAIDKTSLRQGEYCAQTPVPDGKAFRTEEKINPDHISANEKIDLFRSQRSKMLNGDNVVNCRIVYTEELNNKTFIASRGIISEEIRHVSHFLTVYVSDGEVLKYDYISKGGTGGLELIQIEDNEIDELIENANRMLSAENVKPDFYDIVATPEIAGLIAHEAFGHGVETDMYLKNRARSREYLGKSIASPLVSILDDPTLSGGYGSYHIDDEGCIARPTYIIKDGVFVQGLTNRYASLALGLPATANGRRESFARKVYTRMSNTFFKPGSKDPGEIIGSVKHGIYLIKGLSGMEDPKGWGIQVLVLYGKEIKNGKLTERIFSPLGITGFVPDLLGDVSMVGNDFKVDLGLCGKGYKEYIPVSSGGPHIRTRARLG